MVTTSQNASSTGSAGPDLGPLLLACLAATWLVWGSTYLAIKFALLSFPPFFQMGSRFLAAGALLTLWCKARGAPWPNQREWANALFMGCLMLGGGMGATAVAETTVGSGLVVAFIGVSPMLMALFNLAFGLRPARLELVGIGVGLMGVLMLTQGSGFQASPQGLIAISVACLSWALGSVLGKHRFPLAKGAMGYASEMLCGGAVLMALSLATGESPAWPPRWEAVSAWVYLVVFGSLIAFNAYLVLLEKAPTGLASSYSFVNPVIAMFLGVALGGETVTPFEWLAVSVILGGVVLLFRARR
jgi:drug/metabolite transporter (DMT)-like permease